ncbi:MAG: LD-carboxypeptidase [Clostridium sp.]|nr:LD-carboxypeptidase [Clostridium sp.]
MAEGKNNIEDSQSSRLDRKICTRIALVSCSNGMAESFRPAFLRLLTILEDAGLETVYGNHLFAGKENPAGQNARDRAEELMEYYCDPSVDAVFDISGGDMANEILPWLDYEAIKQKGQGKLLFGYSDLTCVLNAVYGKTGCACGLYQLRNLLHSQGREQLESLLKLLKEEGRLWGRTSEASQQLDWAQIRPLTDLKVYFLQGTFMEGVAVGGNIRCLLKLAGTPYLPDFSGKILILEGNSGGADKLTACLSQLSQMGVFERINGILLGTFTEMERRGDGRKTKELVRSFASTLPIAVTEEIGHGSGARCAVIGRTLKFEI